MSIFSSRIIPRYPMATNGEVSKMVFRLPIHPAKIPPSEEQTSPAMPKVFSDIRIWFRKLDPNLFSKGFRSGSGSLDLWIS